jgi:PKD repeat protein
MWQMPMKETALKLTMLVLIGLIMCPIQASAQISHPSPSYEYAPLTPRVGDTVTFDASIFMAHWKESTIISLDWDFADGTTQTGTVVEHSFAKPGEYWVELSATDNRGMTASTAHLVTVTEQTPITVYLSLSNERVYIGQDITISGDLISNGKAYLMS